MHDAADKLNRMVALVAELSRRRSRGLPPATLDELAAVLDSTAADVQTYLRELTRVSDSADAEWLLSLQLLLEGDTVEGGSAGPFQRPMRLTPEEALVLRLSLGVQDDGTVDAAAVEPLFLSGNGEAPVQPYRRAAGIAALLDLLLHAGDRHRTVRIRYAPAAAGREAGDRVIHPGQVLVHRGRTYVVAWCELRVDWRRFRLDRILEAEMLDESYDARDDCPYDTVFAGAAEADAVRVRFSPSVARWIREWSPDADEQPDGGITVTYHAASTEWLVQRVLQYGPEAEVLEPAWYREAMREAVGE